MITVTTQSINSSLFLFSQVRPFTELLNAYYDQYFSSALLHQWFFLSRTLRPKDISVLICQRKRWSFHNHFSFVWIPDPAFPHTNRVSMQRICSRYNTAGLTFSTASLLRKLCNCITGFFFNKSPEMRSTWPFSPTRSETVSRERVCVEVHPLYPTYHHNFMTMQ